jgi:hypothetical protein
MQDTINEMTTNQCFLNVFEEKDITGIELSKFESDFQSYSVNKIFLMHLYARKLEEKNCGAWMNFPYPQTRLINMSNDRVYRR